MIQFLGINSLNRQFNLIAFVRNVGEEEKANAGFVLSFKRDNQSQGTVNTGRWNPCELLRFYPLWVIPKDEGALYMHHTSPVNLERSRFPRTKWRDLSCVTRLYSCMTLRASGGVCLVLTQMREEFKKERSWETYTFFSNLSSLSYWLRNKVEAQRKIGNKLKGRWEVTTEGKDSDGWRRDGIGCQPLDAEEDGRLVDWPRHYSVSDPPTSLQGSCSCTFHI